MADASQNLRRRNSATGRDGGRHSLSLQEEKTDDDGEGDEVTTMTRNPMRLSHHRRLSSLESAVPNSEVMRSAATSVVAHSPRRNRGKNWKRTRGKRFGLLNDGNETNPAGQEFELAASRLALEDKAKSGNSSATTPKRSLVKGPKVLEGENNGENGCSYGCSCVAYLWHNDLRVRTIAWIVATMMLAYTAFSVYVTIDLLKLLRCMHASCDDWCFKLMSASVVNLTRLDNTLFVTAEIAVQWPSTTEAMLGKTEIKLRNQQGVQMMRLVTTDLPRFSRIDGSTTRVIEEGKSTMKIAARVDVEDIEAGAKEFGKAQSEGLVELAVGLKSTVTVWRYTYIPITVTLPLPFDLPLTCRKFNDSMACDVGAASEYEDDNGGFLKCIEDGSMELRDPQMEFLQFMPQQLGEDPDTLNIQTNFTVQHGSTMGLYADLPELTMDVYYSSTPLDESKRINATSYPGLEALSHVTVRHAELRGQTVTGLVFVQIDARGKERLRTISELVDDLVQTNINGPTGKGFFLYVQGPDVAGTSTLLKRMLAKMPMIRLSNYPSLDIKYIAANFESENRIDLHSVGLQGLQDRTAFVGGILSVDLPFRLQGVFPPMSLVVESARRSSFATVELRRLEINQTQRVEFMVEATVTDDAEAFAVLSNVSIAGVTVRGSGDATASFLSRALASIDVPLEVIAASALYGTGGNNGTGYKLPALVLDDAGLGLEADLIVQNAVAGEPGPSVALSTLVKDLPLRFDFEVPAMDVTVSANGLDIARARLQPGVFTNNTGKDPLKNKMVGITTVYTSVASQTLQTLLVNEEYVTFSVKDNGQGIPVSIGNLTFRAPKEITQLLKMNASELSSKGRCSGKYNEPNETIAATGALCLGVGDEEYLRIDHFGILGGSNEIASNVSIPCVFSNAMCPRFSQKSIQDLGPTHFGLSFEGKLFWEKFFPLSRASIEIPELRLNVDFGGGSGIAGLSLQLAAMKIDSTKDDVAFALIAGVEDWSSVLRTLFTFEDVGAELAITGGTSNSSIAAAMPTLTYAFAPQDLKAQLPPMPAIPLPMVPETGNGDEEVQPWRLVATTSTSATFRIDMNFVNPFPIGVRFPDAKIDIAFPDPELGGENVTFFSIEMDPKDLVIVPGNNSVVAYGTLYGNAGVESCAKDACFSQTIEDPSSCVPCSFSKVLNLFLGRQPTPLKTTFSYRNEDFSEESNGNGTVTTAFAVNLLVFPKSTEDEIVAKGRTPDFIDSVVSPASIIDRSMFFQINFWESIGATLQNGLTNLLGATADGRIDLNIDNIFSFNIKQTKLHVRRVDMSDANGVPSGAPFYNPRILGIGPYAAEYRHRITLSNIFSDQEYIVRSGERSTTPIKIPVQLSWESLARALEDSYAQGRLCLHINGGLMNMEMTCDREFYTVSTCNSMCRLRLTTKAQPTSYSTTATQISPLTCISSDPFKFSAPFGMPNVPLFKREGCFNPPTCTPTMQQEIFSYGFGSSFWATSAFTTWGSATLSGSSGVRLVSGSTQHGSVWRNTKIVGVQAGFRALFKFRISKDFCLFCGDDAAFAFVVQNGNELDPEGDTSAYACGSNGVELAMEGVDSVPIADFKTRLTCGGYKNMGGKSIAVVFSTKENRMYNLGLTADQPRASVSVWRNGQIQSGTASSSRRQQSEAVLAYSQVYEDYGDGGERTAEIRYDPVWRQLYVKVNDQLVLNAAVDLSSSGIDLGNDAWVGFSSRTEQSFTFGISAFSVARPATDLSKSIVSGGGTALAVAGRDGVFVLDTRDSCSLPRLEGGGQDMVNTIKSGLSFSGPGSVVVKEVEDKGDSGLFKVRFSALATGQYSVFLSGAKIDDFYVV